MNTRLNPCSDSGRSVCCGHKLFWSDWHLTPKFLVKICFHSRIDSNQQWRARVVGLGRLVSAEQVRSAPGRAGRYWPRWCRHPAPGRRADQSLCRPAYGQFERAEGGLMANPNASTDARTVTVRVPISIRRRGGRKLVLAPDGRAVTWAAPPRRVDNAMVKAIAPAFRWRVGAPSAGLCAACRSSLWSRMERTDP